MNVVIVSTEEFWCRLCDVRARRISRFSVRIENVLYVTLEAPEDVPNMLERVKDQIASNLGFSRLDIKGLAEDPAPRKRSVFRRLLGI